MSLSCGKNKSSNRPVIEQAAITPEQRQQLFPQVGNLLGFNFSSQGGFTPQDVSQQFGQTSSQFARRGLGASPIAASSVAGSIAPSLIAMRQQQLQNLFSGLSGELQQGQNLLTQRGQDINSLLGQRQQQLAGLLQFLEQMGFRRNLGQQGSASGFNTGVGLPASWTSGGGGVTTG